MNKVRTKILKKMFKLQKFQNRMTIAENMRKIAVKLMTRILAMNKVGSCFWYLFQNFQWRRRFCCQKVASTHYQPIHIGKWLINVIEKAWFHQMAVTFLYLDEAKYSVGFDKSISIDYEVSAEDLGPRLHNLSDNKGAINDNHSDLNFKETYMKEPKWMVKLL